MDDALLHAFRPGLAAYRGTLRPPQPDAVPLAELLQPEPMAALIAAYGASLSSGDRRAVLSMWSQHYLLALIPPAVATALVTPRQPAMALCTASVLLSDTGQPRAVCVPGLEWAAATTCPAERLTPLLRDHLAPLAQGLAGLGLHQAVLWSNAGHVLSWVLKAALAPGDGVAALLAALQQPLWIDGGPNAVWQSLGPASRTACCLRHRLPGTARCSACPLVQRRDRRHAGCLPGRDGLAAVCRTGEHM